jgi:hypothetical protein
MLETNDFNFCRYHVKEDVGKQLFDSCSSDSSGITRLICLTKLGKDCTDYKDFLHAIGDQDVTTFDIEFKFEVKEEEPFVLDAPELLSCEEKFKGTYI